MKIAFATNQLRRRYESFDAASRAWGDAVARKYIQRVNYILAADDFSDLRKIRSLRLHKLSGNRSDQYAVSLNARWRVALKYDPANKSVTILEVNNHYGD